MENVDDIIYLEEESPCTECLFHQYCKVMRTACPDFRVFVQTGAAIKVNREMSQRIYNKLFTDGYEIVDLNPIIHSMEDEKCASLTVIIET